MPVEIALTDGTKITADGTADEWVKDESDPHGWVDVNEGEDTPKRWINAAQIVYVRDVEPSGPPLYARAQFE